MISKIQIIYYLMVCLLYSIFSIFFKYISNLELHSMLFITVSTMFASVFFLIRGSYNRLIIDALLSISTWVYVGSFILIFVFSIELLKYISATEMILVSRLNVVTSLILSLVFLKRNTLGNGIWGVPLIVLGIILTLSQVENSLLYVFVLGVCSSMAKSSYFLSMELTNEKNHLNNFAVFGGVLAIGSIFSVIFMLSGSIIFANIGMETRLFPTFEDYYNPKILILGAGYGLIGFTILRILEFKTIHKLNSELFICLIAFVPLITLVLEAVIQYFDIVETNISLNPALLMANVLIISGSLLIIVLKLIHEELFENSDKSQLVKIVQNTLVFTDDDFIKAAEILETKEEKIKEIINNKNFKVLKSEFKSINANFNQKIAMADHLTGLCNKLEFQTKLKHIDKNISSNLFFIDLNKFKPVNDTYGHDAGDFILQGIAKRLENLFKSSLLTRLGGDEFTLLVNESNKEDIKISIEQILKEIEKEFIYKGERIVVSASIGAANYPEDTDNPEDLIKLADKQMYIEKSER